MRTRRSLPRLTNKCCESVASIHFAARRNFASDGGVVVIGGNRLQAARHFSVAGGGLSDHPGRDILSGSQSGCHGFGHYAPLERQFGQMPGLNQMTSVSSDGSSIITLQFALNLNIDVAEQEVQEGINAAQTFLPPDLPAPPIYSKSNPADAP